MRESFFSMRFSSLRRCAPALLAVALTGCEQLVAQRGERDQQAAEKKASAGDFRAAVRLYESALDGSAKTADLHYKLGALYADKLRSPLDALHHFDRYLELAPSGAYAKEAKANRRECEARLLQTLTKGSPPTQEEAVRLKNENFELRKTLATVRAQKAATPPPLPPGMKKGEQVKKPIPPGSRLHTVGPGETLGSIAGKYYKSKARWKDIQDANFYSLEGTAKIKPGMELIIP